MERESLEGIAAAEEHLGRAVPLPAAPLPLARWVEVVTCGSDAVQVEWNLDATRPGTPGRLTLYAGHAAAPDRGLTAAAAAGRYAHRSAPLREAEAELRPVQELAWEDGGLHLRLTGQGPWELAALVVIADSIGSLPAGRPRDEQIHPIERLTVNELVAMAGGLLLGACLFADWYSSVSPLAMLAGTTGVGMHSGWETHPILRWALLVMAVAPFILAYIVARDHQLTWARGELTAVLSITAVGLLLYVGVIDRPGEPSGQIELAWGWYVSLLGGVLMLAGSALRTGETERRRKPPGTI